MKEKSVWEYNNNNDDDYGDDDDFVQGIIMLM